MGTLAKVFSSDVGTMAAQAEEQLGEEAQYGAKFWTKG